MNFSRTLLLTFLLLTPLVSFADLLPPHTDLTYIPEFDRTPAIQSAAQIWARSKLPPEGQTVWFIISKKYAITTVTQTWIELTIPKADMPEAIGFATLLLKLHPSANRDGIGQLTFALYALPLPYNFDLKFDPNTFEIPKLLDPELFRNSPMFQNIKKYNPDLLKHTPFSDDGPTLVAP